NGSLIINNKGTGGIAFVPGSGGLSSTTPLALPGNPTANLHAAPKQYVDSSVTGMPASQAYRQGNILGTVSQSGGVPTGALIQTGSNANGSYVRYADGTQICWGAVTGTVPAAPGATYASTNFPIA